MTSRRSPRFRLLDPPLSRGYGIVSVREAHALGVSSRVLQNLVNRGELLSIAKGMYVDRRRYEALDPWSRYRVRSAAFTVRSPGSMASEWSAAILLGLPTWGAPPELPTIARAGPPAGGTTRTPNGRGRHLPAPQKSTSAHGVPCSGMHLTAADLARSLDFADGLCLVDAADRGEPHRGFGPALESLRACSGIARARRVCLLADGRSESVVESYGRAALIEAGLPVPVSNVWIADGRMPHRVDQLLVEGSIVLEADGRLKYAGASAADVIRAEKEREWRLREMGFAVLRYDLALARGRPRELARRVGHLLEQRRGHAAAVGWSWDRPAAA